MVLLCFPLKHLDEKIINSRIYEVSLLYIEGRLEQLDMDEKVPPIAQCNTLQVTPAKLSNTTYVFHRCWGKQLGGFGPRLVFPKRKLRD